MYKLVVFDLDDTLAPVGKCADSETLEKIKKLRANGITIAISSGKPVYYLCGFCRAAGLYDAVMIGENGAVISFGVELPPKLCHRMSLSRSAADGLALLRREIVRALPDIWFQPNELVVTPFPINEAEFDTIQRIVDENAHQLTSITAVRHSDSFDFFPDTISKQESLRTLCEMLSIGSYETIAVGNGENDYPMFDYAGLSVGVNVPDSARVDRNFTNINDALDYIAGLTDFSSFRQKIN